MILEESPPPRETKLEILYDEISFEIATKRKQIDDVDNKIKVLQDQISHLQQYRETQQRLFRDQDNLRLRMKNITTRISQLLASYNADSKQRPATNPLSMFMKINSSCVEESAEYTATIEAAFRDQHYPASPFVVSRQIQLCRYVHYLTIHKNQLYLLQVQSSEYINGLEIEKQNQQKKLQTNKNELGGKNMILEKEIERIESELDRYKQYIRRKYYMILKEAIDKEQTDMVESILYFIGQDSDFVSGNESGNVAVVERSDDTIQKESCEIISCNSSGDIPVQRETAILKAATTNKTKQMSVGFDKIFPTNVSYHMDNDEKSIFWTKLLHADIQTNNNTCSNKSNAGFEHSKHGGFDKIFTTWYSSMNTTKNIQFGKSNQLLTNKISLSTEIKESEVNKMLPILSWTNTTSSLISNQSHDANSCGVTRSSEKSQSIKIDNSTENLSSITNDIVIPDETHASNVDDFIDTSMASDFEEINIQESQRMPFEHSDERDSYLESWSAPQIHVPKLENMISWFTGKPT